MISQITTIVIFIALLFTSVEAQTTDDKAQAMRLANEGEKHILLVFSGSDWCQPCIRFDKNVLQNEEFASYAKASLVILKCDFPQVKKLSEATLKQNEALAEQFNPNGEFPTLLLLDSNMEKVGHLKYTSQSIPLIIKEIKQQLPQPIVPKEYRKKEALMGSFFEFIIIAPTNEEKKTWQQINDCIAEAKRIEALISEWIPSSEISKINQNAGKEPVTVSEEVYLLLQRSLALSKITQGAFDLTFLAYYNYWKFDKTQVFPFDTSQVKLLSKLVDYHQIQLLPNRQVSLPEGVKIGLGGIGQGYAVDKIKKLLLEKGIENFVINSSGDVYAHGQGIEARPWKVGITSPIDKNKIVKWLPVSNFAVVTSGTSEKNFEYNNKIYGHIINPKTGFPVEGLQSVTVISEITEIADALATSILILGTEIGLDLINQMPNTHCIIIDSNQEVHYSEELQVKN